MKKLKIFAKVIAIIIICLIGFVGIYLPWQRPLQMNNMIKDFSLGKDFTGYREIMLEVSEAVKVLDSDKKVVGDTDIYDDSTLESYSYTKSEEKVNGDDKLNVENFEKSKSIIEKRLKDLGVQEYNLSMDKGTGKIYMQIPENSITDKVVSNITEIGSVELKDSEDESKVLLTNDNFQKAQVLYSSTETGTAVYLSLQFDNDGKKILKDISENEYKTIEDSSEEKTDEEKSEDEELENEESDEKKSEEKELEEKDSDKKDSEKKDSEEKDSNDENEEQESEKKEQKQVTLYISENGVTTTSFDEAVTDGTIPLRMGQVSSDAESVQETALSAKTVAATLNNGVMPLKYNVVDNKYIQSEIKTSTIKNIIIAVLVIFALLLVYMIIKYKARGLLATLSYLGFVSLYTIIIRLFNVPITMEAIVGGIIILALNYLVNMKLIQIHEDGKKYYQTYLDIIMKLIPVIAFSIIFVFMPVLALSSIGMAVFWGIVLILGYNIAITRQITD